MKTLKIKPRYEEIATKCIFSNQDLQREDIEKLGLFNPLHISKLMDLKQCELKRLLLDVITKESIVEY